MRKLLLFVFAAVAFAACEQAPIEEQSAIRQDAPDTITVGFEGDDETRIQLNEVQKTVWTKGDQVSVFYKSYDNLKFEFEGNTGDRNGTLKKVGGNHNGQTMDDVVVVYPYSADYMITLSEGGVNATIPHKQTYLKDSYGVGDNIMIARSSFNQFSLKSVCGWLKVQLTGDNEVVKSITLRGNNGEQVAGLVYVDATTAEATLATAMNNSDDNSQLDGNLILDDSIYTEVVLDCGEGVALGAEATAFYIALPPQTFEKGFKVEIVCTDSSKMVKSSSKTLSIERNHIQPMTTMEFVASVPNNQIWYTSSDGNVVTPYETDYFDANIVSNTYSDGKGVITFDGDITMIGNDAFYKCSSLTSVTIPDSVTKIKSNAFQGCTSLTSANIPYGVTTIGQWAFYECYNLTGITIPDSVTTIGDSTFYKCTSLTSITIPNSVISIGNWVFDGCTSLASVTIGDSVTTIGTGVFTDCSSLAEFSGKFAEDNGRILVVDGSLEAFAPAGLTEYTIPDSVTIIGHRAFKNCTNLISVTIPDCVTTIGLYAFSQCTNLISVTIPNNITIINSYSFAGCKSLASITIPDSVTKIGTMAFSGCESLKSVTIPDGVTNIYNQAFQYCTGLTSITIPNSVTTIESAMFQYCTSLTSVTIPDSVTEIKKLTFYECSNLTSVYCEATTPPVLGSSSVFRANGSGRKIYVPTEAVEAYKSAQYWSNYADAIVGYDF